MNLLKMMNFLYYRVEYSMMKFASKMTLKLMNFAFKLMNFAFKLMNFAFKLMNFAFKLMHAAQR